MAKRRNKQNQGKGSMPHDNSQSVATRLTNAVNTTARAKWGEALNGSNDPAWYERFPTLAQISINPWMPYSSLASIMNYNGWIPPHVLAVRVRLGQGGNDEPRRLAVDEVWNDMRSQLRSNLAYTIQDLASYIEAVHYARLIAKSAEAYLRMALTAQADDPNLLGTLFCAKFGFDSIDAVLKDITAFGPQIKMQLTQFATWLVNNVPYQDSYLYRIDMMENAAFLETTQPNSPMEVFSLSGQCWLNETLQVNYNEWSATGQVIVDKLNQLQANWNPVFTTIAADMRHAYRNAIYQAWDFTLINYAFVPIYDPLIKQQLKNAEVMPWSVLVDGVETNVGHIWTDAASYSAQYTAKEVGQIKLTGAKGKKITLANRSVLNGGISLTLNDSNPTWEGPRQYFLSILGDRAEGGVALETTHLMANVTAFLNNDDVIVQWAGGPENVGAIFQVTVNNDGTVTKTRMMINSAYQAGTSKPLDDTILTNSWSETMPLSALIRESASATVEFLNVGNVAFDRPVAWANLNLEWSLYASIASLYRVLVRVHEERSK